MAVRIQRITKTFKTDVDAAIMYYSLICVINNILISEREIQLLAYTSVRGTISSISAKEEFSTMFGSSVASVNNMISKLKGIGLIKKIQNKYRVPSSILPRFNEQDMVLSITIKKNNVQTATDNTEG